jgi:hypothetical protein
VLAGCVSAQALSLPDSHPASPRAETGSVRPVAALESYRSPADFAARGPAREVTAQAAEAQPSGVGTVNAVNPERRTVNLSHEPSRRSAGRR